MRRELAEWVQQAHDLSQRHAAGLIPVNRATLRYEHHRDPQDALRVRLRELAGSRVRYGYRRLTVMLKREGWEVNAKRIYRLYTEEGLIVRTKRRKERAQRQRVAQGRAVCRNDRLSMDFVAQRLADGRWIRVLTVVDQYTRECLTLHADIALSGEKVAAALDKIVASRGAPKSITVDNGTEFASKAMDHWAYTNGVHLDFIRPGRPVENGYIESFNGRLRDECLNVEVFLRWPMLAASWLSGCTITTTTDLTRRSPIARRQSSQPYAAVDMTAIRLPWKTLRVYHISTARRLLAVI